MRRNMPAQVLDFQFFSDRQSHDINKLGSSLAHNHSAQNLTRLRMAYNFYETLSFPLRVGAAKRHKGKAANLKRNALRLGLFFVQIAVVVLLP